MSVQDDAAAVDRRINGLFGAIDGEDAAPQIASFEGSSTFQALLAREQTLQTVNQGGVGADASVPELSAPPEDIERDLRDASASSGVELPLLEAIGKNESGFRSNATSPAGAQGVMQLMPGTAAGLGVSDSYDARQNINGAAKYVRGLLDEFSGNIPLTVAAYNAGAGAVKKYNGIPPYAETKNYVNNVMASYEKYRAQQALASNSLPPYGSN
jgi:soluble lytic murein transglycosylase-like protein